MGVLRKFAPRKGQGDHIHIYHGLHCSSPLCCVKQAGLEPAWPAECLLYTTTAAGILLQLDDCSMVPG